MSIVSISDDSPNRHLADKHFVNIGEIQQDCIRRQAEEWGFKIDSDDPLESTLRNDFVERATWNRLVQSEIYRAIPDEVRKPVQEGLFGL